MGQQASGILYGCEAPELPGDDGESIYDLVTRWENSKPPPPYAGGLRIRIESEGGKTLLGVWVAVSGSGEDNTPYFPDRCMPLGQVVVVYQKSIAKAKKLWDRFAVWAAKKEGITLPAATLWLTPCETA